MAAGCGDRVRRNVLCYAKTDAGDSPGVGFCYVFCAVQGGSRHDGRHSTVTSVGMTGSPFIRLTCAMVYKLTERENSAGEMVKQCAAVPMAFRPYIWFFPNSPILQVEGTFGECTLLETLLLSILNYDSAVASRMRPCPAATP